ncbi:hypothetical protein SSTU70S_04116 [Stutzerimonas stutzeri]
MSTIDQDIEQRIAQQVAEWQRGVTSRGAPLPIDSAWLQTPQGLRLPFQVLKSAGVPPREMDPARARPLARTAAGGADGRRAHGVAAASSELEQHLAVRLEALERMGRG